MNSRYFIAKYFSFLFLIYGLVPAMAQPFYSHSYDIEPDARPDDPQDQLLQSSVAKEEGTYYLQDVTVENSGGFHANQAVTFLQDNKDVGWQKILKIDRGPWDNLYGRHSMAATEDGVVVVGNSFTTKLEYSVVFLNREGEQIKQYTYVPEYNGVARGIAQGANGNYYIAGTEYLDSIIDGRYSSTFLSIIDENGEELYYWNYDLRSQAFLGSDIHYKVYALPDGDVLITALAWNFYAEELWCLRVDSKGKKKWKYRIKENTPRGSPHPNSVDVIYDESGDRIYLTFVYADDNLPRLDDSRRAIYALNGQGKVLWEVGFSSGDFSFISSLALTGNGDIIVCGMELEDEDDGASPALGWLAKVSKDGEKLWGRLVRETGNRAVEAGQSQFIAVDIIENGNILLGGNIIDTVGGGYFNVNAWIVRLDSLGYCYGEECPEIIDIDYRTSVVMPTFDFQIYPNPTSDYFIIKNPPEFKGTLELYDVNGKLVKRESLKRKQEIRIDCSAYIPGTYFLQLRSSTGNFYGYEKIIIF